MSQEIKVPAVELQEITLPGRGKVIIKQSLMDQINYLHKKVGAIEWCGILFYRKLSGEIHKSEDFVLQAEQLYPMNIGSETYTASDIDGIDTIEMYERCNPDYDLKQGLIHTHHKMTTFFSGTDMSELHDNAPLHNYYLSLIVNFDGKYTAKIAYVADVINRSTMTFNNSEDQKQEVVATSTKKILVMMDLDVVLQEVVPEYFQERHELLQKQSESRRIHSIPTYSGAGRTTVKGFEDWEKTGTNQQGSLFNEGEFVKREKNGTKTNNKTIWNAIEKAKELESKQFGQKGSGKIVNADGLYVSITPDELTEKTIDWLATGLDVYNDMIVEKSIVNVLDYIQFFEKYFDNNFEELDYFLNSMSKTALKEFKDYSLALISNRVKNLLQPYTYNFALAQDLYNVMDSLQQFAAIQRDYKGLQNNYRVDV